MKRWTHPQDFIALIAGAYALLSPLWTDTTSRATTTMIVLGAITVVLALTELIRPDLMSIEGLCALMGVLFFISPWVMRFGDTRPMAWTAWIVGIVIFAVGVADLQMTRSHHRGDMATSH
jgi:SPW repeat